MKNRVVFIAWLLVMSLVRDTSAQGTSNSSGVMGDDLAGGGAPVALRAILDYRIDTIGSNLTLALLVAVVLFAMIGVLIVARSARSKSRPAAKTEASPQIVLPVRDRERNPERIAAETRAAVWAAETLAGAGMDAAAIARRTGLARDATRLLVARARPIVPGAAGSSPSRTPTESLNPLRRNS